MQRVTIKDIAAITKMSPGTVHRALHGKKGVSEEVREKIISVANELGYKPNYVASALKRKPLNVIVLLPNKTGKNNYYYMQIWEGIENAFLEYQDFNINFIPLSYNSDLEGSKNSVLNNFIEENDMDINGLITNASLGYEKESVLRDITTKIPTALVVDDLEDSDRICFVGGDYFTSGRLCMELLSTQIPQGSDILVFCGKPNRPSHHLTVSGIESFVEENKLDYTIIKLFDKDDNSEKISIATDHILNNKKLKAIYSVNTKNTVLLCDILDSIEYEHTFKVIGSDIFKESIEHLESGVLDNILYKNPKKQSYRATIMLLDYIVKNEKPSKSVNLSKTELVFKSNLDAYKNI